MPSRRAAIRAWSRSAAKLCGADVPRILRARMIYHATAAETNGPPNDPKTTLGLLHFPSNVAQICPMQCRRRPHHQLDLTFDEVDLCSDCMYEARAHTQRVRKVEDACVDLPYELEKKLRANRFLKLNCLLGADLSDHCPRVRIAVPSLTEPCC